MLLMRSHKPTPKCSHVWWPIIVALARLPPHAMCQAHIWGHTGFLIQSLLYVTNYLFSVF